ncbi:hypothetical protein ACFLQ1_02475, partial [Candidatus Auribacterota bacterium]
KDCYLGIEFAREGFIVIMPSFRAMEADKKEKDISLHLMLNNFTLMGLRVYESLLILEYLLCLDMVDPFRIGIIAHSGGSVVANLLVRITDKVQALAIDHVSNYVDLLRDFRTLHCEVIPYLCRYRETLNNQKSLHIPVIKVRYNYFKNHKESILNFFKEHLKFLTKNEELKKD